MMLPTPKATTKMMMMMMMIRQHRLELATKLCQA
jgi:hypothetical protein